MRDVCGQVLDSSRGLGMVGEKGIDSVSEAG